MAPAQPQEKGKYVKYRYDVFLSDFKWHESSLNDYL